MCRTALLDITDGARIYKIKIQSAVTYHGAESHSLISREKKN